MKNILITGAAGFIGRELVRAFSGNDDVKIFLSDWRPIAVGMKDAYSYIQSDLSKIEQAENLIARTKPSHIYHLAGSADDDFNANLTGNVVITRNMLEAVSSSDLHIKILLMGSAAEYGRVTPDENPIQETHALEPVSAYGLTKMCQTKLMDFYVRTRGMDIVMARSFNLSGADAPTHTFIGIIQKQIKCYRRGAIKTITIDHPDLVRDYLEVADAVRCYGLIMEHGQKGEVYNVGSGQPTTLRDFVCALLEREGIPGAVLSKSVSSNRTEGGIPVMYADVKKLHQLKSFS